MTVVAWGPAIKVAVKVAPVAIEVARQVDRQVRPHVLAYRAARDVDGYVGRWTDDDGTHWLVFPDPSAEVLRAFPPLSDGEREKVGRELNRRALTHHSELPEAKAWNAAAKLRTVPGRATSKVRRRDVDETVDVSGPPALPGR